MDIRELRRKAMAELEVIYGEKEAGNLIYILLEWLTGYSKTSLALNPDIELGIAESNILLEKIEELKQQKPVQYITGQAWFCGLEFKVNEQVLIPRPETEELVDWVVRDHRERPGLRVLDIGTGSGCIAVVLGKSLQEPVIMAVDKSPAAIALAVRNAFLHGAEVNFMQLDVLDPESHKGLGKFDVIVSNPPYVRLSEKDVMKPNVLDHEPHQALFVPDEDPLIFYRAIARIAGNDLYPGGMVYVEINEGLGEETVQLFRRAGFAEVELRMDIHGKDRMVRSVNPK
jgi:release factor glutamine methyltransferase